MVQSKSPYSHNSYLQLKKNKIRIITMFVMEIILFIELFIYQRHQESYYVSIQMYVFAKEMANS